MRNVVALVIILLSVAYPAIGQSIVPDEVVQVGENVFSNALGWQAYQGSSTLLYVPLGGAMLSFGAYNLIQFFTAPAVMKPIAKLVVGVTCILAAGIAVGYSVTTTDTW